MNIDIKRLDAAIVEYDGMMADHLCGLLDEDEEADRLHAWTQSVVALVPMLQSLGIDTLPVHELAEKLPRHREVAAILAEARTRIVADETTEPTASDEPAGLHDIRFRGKSGLLYRFLLDDFERWVPFDDIQDELDQQTDSALLKTIERLNKQLVDHGLHVTTSNREAKLDRQK